jgi:hypothetical protein
VAVGDTWEAPAEAVKRLLRDGHYESGSVSLKLLEVKDVDGVRCAVIHTALALKGTEAGGFSLKVEGPAVIRLDRGYLMSFTAKGTGTLERDGLKGEGPITIDMTSKVE